MDSTIDSTSYFAPTESFETICLRAGQGHGDGDPLVAPIAQSTTFCRDRIGSDCTHQYSRVSNPTVAALEATLGALEAAPPALCFATGLAAETALFLATLRAGDHCVCGRTVYGGTTRLLQQILPGLGVETTFVDATDPDEIERAVQSNTRLIFIETPANPTLELTDIRAAADIAHAAGAILAVDNTFLTAVLQQPLDLGADISVYSTTKFVDGHSVAMGGALVSRDESLLDRVRFIRKSTGAIQTPFNAWLTIQGLRTLPLRIERQSRTAAAIARALARDPRVERVNHPSLPAFPQADLAERQHLGAHGAVISFEIAGGYDAARTFASSLRLCRLVEHVGSIETLITHPASMTHADVDRAERLASGVTDGLLRLSVGLEPYDAILGDIDRALEIAQPSKEATPCLVSA